MSGILQASYQCLYYLYDSGKAVWPLNLVLGARPKEPSSKTWRTVFLLGRLLYRHAEAGVSAAEVYKKVKELPFDEDILSVKDPDENKDLLHHAIITDNKDVVNVLLQNAYMRHGVSCNSYTHLAASLGHIFIMQSLLERRPHDIHTPAGLCYPQPHIYEEERQMFGAVYRKLYHCQLRKYLPIEYAIIGDHLNCFKLLFDSMSTTPSRHFEKMSPHYLLGFAAERGAEKCLDYLVSKFPEAVNEKDKNGDVPLLKAVVWGRTSSKLLIDNGADVKCVAENGDTALHRLYRNEYDGIFAIFDTTRYLLTTGIEQLVNTINLKGETALHLLVTHVSFIGGDCVHTTEPAPRWKLQIDYQQQVIQSIQLLIDFNADPLIFDSDGLQPLNKLLHVTFKVSSPDDSCVCVQSSINSMYVYKNDFKSLGRAVTVLIQNGADVNTQCPIGHTPLILLVQCLLKTEFAELVGQAESIVNLLEVLLSNGANSNFFSDSQATCSTLIAELASRLFRSPIRSGISLDGKGSLKLQYADLINEILQTFLKYGMNPNRMTTKKSRDLSGGVGNALIEFVHITVLASSSEDFSILRKWLVTLLQWGANPDLEPYPSDPIICQSQSNIFLKRQETQAVNHYIHEIKELASIFDNGCAEDLLMLFYNTMDHSTLYHCLNTACFMARFHPDGAADQQFLALIGKMADQPRSLKQISRVSIYKSLDHRLAQTVDDLPLPSSLKSYLLNIE